MSAVQILLIEDNLTDILLAQEILDRIDVPFELHIAKDGEEAMEFLQRKNGFRNAPRPDFVLLDLNLPRINGRQVLENIKTNQPLKSIPVTVLSTSDSPEDITHAYNMHANCYVVKPKSFSHFSEALDSLIRFWFNLVKLPQR